MRGSVNLGEGSDDVELNELLADTSSLFTAPVILVFVGDRIDALPELGLLRFRLDEPWFIIHVRLGFVLGFPQDRVAENSILSYSVIPLTSRGVPVAYGSAPYSDHFLDSEVYAHLVLGQTKDVATFRALDPIVELFEVGMRKSVQHTGTDENQEFRVLWNVRTAIQGCTERPHSISFSCCVIVTLALMRTMVKACSMCAHGETMPRILLRIDGFGILFAQIFMGV